MPFTVALTLLVVMPVLVVVLVLAPMPGARRFGVIVVTVWCHGCSGQARSRVRPGGFDCRG
jgi:hypothetical protein